MSDYKKIVLKIEYDGTHYSGWQRQNNSRSIQATIEDALLTVTGMPISIIGAGRTDAGVHARGQIAHLLIDSLLFPMPINKLKIALNSKLPKDIRISGVCISPAEFHCTRDAIYREYTYQIHTRQSVFFRHFSGYYKYPIVSDRLFEIASIFLGSHDFTSFSKYNASTKSYICNVSLCTWQVGNSADQFMLTIGANRFVYGMVRSLTGTMLDYARGIVSKDDILMRLAQPSRDPSIKRSALVSPEGLTLQKVMYPAIYSMSI